MGKPRSQLIYEAKRLDAFNVKLAREDINFFCEYVLKDESTGESIKQAPMHEAWHELLDRSDRTIVWSAIETGKTQQISVSRTLFELGHNPNLKCLILSATQHQARKVASAIKRYIEDSEELHRVFPDLKPGRPWGEYAFSVERKTISKDPTVQVSGLHGNIQGSRLNRVIADDVLNYENTKTEHNRKDTLNWFLNAPVSRMLPDGKIVIVGVAYNPSDLLHVLARSPQYTAVRYPVLDDDGKPRWEERWPLERIAAKELELGSTEYHRQLLCKPRDDKSAKFKQEWIDKCLMRGNGIDMTAGLKVVPRGYKVYTGVDLAVSPRDSADLTCFFTIAVDPQGSRHVLDIESGRFAGPEIVSKIESIHHRYQSIIMVESNSAQMFIVQFARQKAVPVIPYTTGRNKAHPEFGIESIAAELESGMWVIPNRDGVCHPEIKSWIDGMLYYDPSAHTSDHVMACFFAREAIRRGQKKVQQAKVDFLRR